jgi:hypothetical protein
MQVKSFKHSKNFQDIFSCQIWQDPKLFSKISDDKDDDDDDEVSQIILINKFVKLCKFTSQSV